jgi:hypothetical protein
MKRIKILLFKIFIISLYVFNSATYGQDTIFIQMFDYAGSALPTGWTNVPVSGTAEWKMGVGAGPSSPGMSRLPDSTAYGQQNLYFRRPEANQVTRVITPVIDTEFAVRPQLSFYHAQYPSGEVGSYKYNRLRVLARVGTTGAWQQLASYTAPNFGWEERFIDIPFNQPNVYLAFEGFQDSPDNNSVCIDAILIMDIDSMERVLTNVNTFQASTNTIPTGTDNNQILKTQFRVIGNDGTLELQQFTVKSLNTDDADIKNNGVKIYFTTQDNFSTENLLAEGNFENGEVIFSNLGHYFPTGYSYVWVTYDVEILAGQNHIADAYIPANGIIVNGETYPEANQSPVGHRVIFQTIFYDNFEYDLGWDLLGEWEIDEPQGLGGNLDGDTEGNPSASFAMVGSRIMGTDITGLGVYPGNYEPNLGPKEYQAIMPEINCYYYTNVAVQFYRWLNVYIFDEATIEVSTDGGVEWSVVWNNTSVENQASWNFRTYSIPIANRKENVKLRFTLGNTGISNLQSGWNIDELIVTGSYVTKDVGITDWITPVSNCGLTNQEEVTVVIKNFGAEPSPAEIPLGFSLDGGASWQYDTYVGVLAPEETVVYTLSPKADFSTPGRYNNIIVKTFLPGDQDINNDAFNHQIFSIPTYQTPYYEGFDVNDGLWTAYGTNKSLVRGVPSGTVLNSAYDGSFAWITNPYGKYNADEFSWVESPCFNFSDIEDPVIEFVMMVDTKFGLDGVALEYSIDQGGSWVRAEPRAFDLVWNWHDGTNVIALQNTTGNGQGWSGLYDEWQRVRLILPEALSGESAVRFRLLFASQNTIPVDDEEGFVFDAIHVYETPYDVGVTAIIEPVSDCALSSEEQISINIKNYGIRTLPAGTFIPAGVEINENDPVIENFLLQSDLEPQASANFSFVNLFDFSEVGNYDITAYTLMPGDTDFFDPGFFNDTTSVSISVYGFPLISIWPEDTIYTTQPEIIVFDAGPGFVNYLWQDNSTNQTFAVSSPNTLLYSVLVTDNNGCQSIDSVLVYTRDIEITSLESPVSDCEFFDLEPIKISISNVGFDPYETGHEISVNAYFQTIFIENKLFTLEQPLNPSESLLLEFDTEVDLMSFGEYGFSFELIITDAETDNNSADFSVFARGYPAVDIGDTIYTLQPHTMQLDAGDGMASYLWQDNYTGQIYNVSSPLTQVYSVTITDIYGCSNYDEVLIITYDIGVTAITNPADACELGTNERVSFRLTSTGLDTYPQNVFDAELTHNGTFIGNQVFEITEAIAVGNFVEFEFDSFVDLTEFQTHDFIIEVFVNDADNTNNILNANIITHGYPEPYLPPYIITDNPSTVVLNPGAGFASYLWNDSSTNSTLDINDWGIYSVTVTNDFGCEGSTSTTVVPEVWELSLLEIVSPANVCFKEGEDEDVVFKLFNFGPAPVYTGEEIDFFYEIDGGGVITETIILTSDFIPDTAKDFMLVSKITEIEIGQFDIVAWFEFANDFNTDNNIIETTFDVYQAPETALPDTIFTSTPIGHVIDAGEGFISYLWQDDSIDRFFTIVSGLSQWYYVTVIDVNLCSVTDSVFVMSYDWAISEIVSPNSNCVLSDSEPIIFKLKNFGYDTFNAGEEFIASYNFNNQGFIDKNITLAEDLIPDGDLEIQFDEYLDLSEIGEYSLIIAFDFLDINQGNNSINLDIENAGLPEVYLGQDINTNRPDTVVLDAGAGFASYLWHNGHAGQTFNVQSFGLHWVEVEDVYECSARDSIYISPATSIEEFLANDVVLYPNPANNFLIVKNLFTVKDAYKVQILDINGRLYKSLDISDLEKTELMIYIGDLSEGQYILRIISHNNVTLYKFAKIDTYKLNHR